MKVHNVYSQGTFNVCKPLLFLKYCQEASTAKQSVISLLTEGSSIDYPQLLFRYSVNLHSRNCNSASQFTCPPLGGRRISLDGEKKENDRRKDYRGVVSDDDEQEPGCCTFREISDKRVTFIETWMWRVMLAKQSIFSGRPAMLFLNGAMGITYYRTHKNFCDNFRRYPLSIKFSPGNKKSDEWILTCRCIWDWTQRAGSQKQDKIFTGCLLLNSFFKSQNQIYS